MNELRGIFAPPITPFDRRGDVDEGALRDLIEYLIQQGVHVLFPLGSVGMGPVMTPEQRRRAAENIVDQARGRIPILIHVGAADTQTSVALARHAAELGVAGIALIPPYYYPHTEYEIIEHYRAVAEAVSLPIFLYNNPAFSGINITAALALRLRQEVPTIAGVKLTEDQMKPILDYLRIMPVTFTVLAGFNYYLTATVPLGVRGSVDPLSTFFPKPYVALWDALQRHDYKRAFEWQAQLNEAEVAILGLTAKVGRAVYQELLKLRGLPIQMYPRWRAQSLSHEQIETLRSILKKVDNMGVE
jgi:dihydrodipicolinate synthase/N-acetylneuraminate lyase